MEYGLDELKKIKNGVIAEVTCNILTYPLNTLKTNSQVGQIVKRTNLFKGIQYSILNELINSFLFYSIINIPKIPEVPKIVKTSIGSAAAILSTYPLNTRRKLIQIGKTVKIKNNYSGAGIALLNGVPGTTINFTLYEYFKENLHDDLKPISGYLSSIISIIITHPLDTISTCVATRSPVKGVFKGFRQRLAEKQLTIGCKMLFMEYLNK